MEQKWFKFIRKIAYGSEIYVKIIIIEAEKDKIKDRKDLIEEEYFNFTCRHVANAATKEVCEKMATRNQIVKNISKMLDFEMKGRKVLLKELNRTTNIKKA